MKTKLQILIAVFSIVFSMAKASAQQPQPAPTPINPTTGLPAGINPATGLPTGSQNLPVQFPQAHTEINPQTGLPEVVHDIDPTTGLPADGSPPFKDANGSLTWIAPSWVDSGKVLTSFQFLDLPLSLMARVLREQFTNDFDIIFPNSSTFDVTACNVNLQLKNVTATEIFSAMNLQFELDNRPVRWELTLNGSRPTAILRVVPQLSRPSPPQIRKAFFVGDMLDEYPGTNDLNKLGDISGKINDAWDETGTSRGRVNIYPSGQLLIVSGTPDQVDLAEQILRALKEKADYETSHPTKRHTHNL